MTAAEFVEVVRKGSDKLRVDDIVLHTGAQELHGKGMLRISPDRIEIEMTLNAGEQPPPQRSGIFSKRDFWRLNGVIEDRLQFKCDHVGPVGKSKSSHELQPTGDCDSVHKIIFDLHPIELIPTGLDTFTTKERNRFYGQIQKQENETNAQGEQSGQVFAVVEPQEAPQIQFEAILRDYPFFLPLRGVEAKGEIGGYDFTLAKDKENEDMHVSLCSKAEHRSSGEQEDWRKFQALMEALAFVHGTNAWPYRVEYWRDGRKVTDRVTSAEKLAHTSHAPFNKSLAFNARIGQVEWDYVQTIKEVAAFFEVDSALRKEVAGILFLFREADNGVHSEITTLAMCALFENLVHLIFRELKLKEKALPENKSLEMFEQARVEIGEHIAQKIAGKNEGYERWQKVVGTANLLTQREKFQAIVSHFELKWENDMELVFKTWQKARNPLVHDTTRADRTEDEFKVSVINESRIAGAINILLLKLFGYSGLMRTSAFEQKYRRI